MNKTLVITLGGVTVLGIGLFAYFNLKKAKQTNAPQDSSALKSVSNSQNPVSTNSGNLNSNLQSVSPSSTKEETAALKSASEKLVLALKEQVDTRPMDLSTIQAISYGADYPESLKGFSSSTVKYTSYPLKMTYVSSDIVQKLKDYWKKSGRPAGHKVRVIKNNDETPITLNDDQAIIYLTAYPDLLKGRNNIDLSFAKSHWVNKGRGEGRRIDLY
jgi:hypothetical protein